MLFVQRVLPDILELHHGLQPFCMPLTWTFLGSAMDVYKVTNPALAKARTRARILGHGRARARVRNMGTWKS